MYIKISEKNVIQNNKKNHVSDQLVSKPQNKLINASSKGKTSVVHEELRLGSEDGENPFELKKLNLNNNSILDSASIDKQQDTYHQSIDIKQFE